MHTSSWRENGLLLAALSSFLFSLCSLIAKYLASLHPVHLSCFSFLAIVLTSASLLLHNGEKLFPERCWKTLASRSLAGTLFLTSSFYSVQMLPLGDASVLTYTAPAFTLLLARWLIREPCSGRSAFLSVLLLASTVLIVRPPFLFSAEQISSDYLLGLTMAFTASLTDALSNVTLRDLRSYHFSVVMFNYGLISFIQTAIISLCFTTWVPLNLTNVLLLLALIILNTIEQIFMTLALKYEKAGLVALVQASDIIYGFAFQVIFFDEKINAMSIVGAIFVIIIICSLSFDSKKQKSDYLVLVY